MVQETWLPMSAHATERCAAMGCSDRDGTNFEGLGKTINTIEQPYRRRLEAQIPVVNTWDATLRLSFQYGKLFLK